MARIGWLGLCLMTALAVQVRAIHESPLLPFVVEDKNGKGLDKPRAVALYLAACRGVARELNPNRPPRLAPKLTLVLDKRAKEEAMEARNGVVVLTLRKWDEEKFVAGVMMAAIEQALGRDDLVAILRRVMVEVNSKVDVSGYRPPPTGHRPPATGHRPPATDNR